MEVPGLLLASQEQLPFMVVAGVGALELQAEAVAAQEEVV
jgi:hypothetical protein